MQYFKEKTVLLIGGTRNKKMVSIKDDWDSYMCRIRCSPIDPKDANRGETGEQIITHEEVYKQYGRFNNIFFAVDDSETRMINKLQELIFKGLEQEQKGE